MVMWIASMGAITIATATIFGLILGWQRAADLANVGITMKPNCAVSVALCGMAILALAPKRPGLFRLFFGYACALAIAALGLMTLSEHLLNVDLRIDHVLVDPPIGADNATDPGRMGAPASTCFALLGFALLLVNRRARFAHIAGQGAALLVGVIAMVSILGNLYGVEELFALARYTGISLQTSLAFMLLTIAYLCLRPNRGVMVALNSPESGGILVRRLLLPCILLPVLLGWLYGLGVRQGLFDEQFGMAIFALALSLLLTGLVLWSGASLNRASRLRRVAELAVIHNERLYRAIGESINYGIWVCDSQGRNTYVSQSFLDLVGATQEQCSKFGWTGLLHPEDVDATLDAWKRCAARGEFWERAHRFKGKDGQWHHLLARGVPIRGDNGDIVAWAGINLDISRLKETEDELRRHKEHLEHLVLDRTKQLESSHQALRMSERMAAMGTLVAGLGHDMGNLLLPIRARLDTLENTELTESAQADVTSIRACIEHLQKLASGLRLFSLDPASDVDMQGATDLASWRLDVEPFMRNALPRGVSLLWGIPDTLPHAKISKHRLTQAVYNLVKNAGDAIAPRGQGTVAVSARTFDQNHVQFIVTDDGPGMSDEVRRHCLEPFYTTKKRGLSTGLGLSIVHGIMQRCGGTIHIDSKLNHGSTFTLTLPASVEVEAQSVMKKAIVMIDNPRLSAMVTATLGNDYQVIQSTQLNGIDAQLCVAEWSPQVSVGVQGFVRERNGRQALIVNCPENDNGALPNDRRLISITGWPKVTELRRALQQLSQSLPSSEPDVQIKPMRSLSMVRDHV
jgi:PAS domain S-box-containing protein